jgi:ketosteroid isomerase-like protein
MRIAVLLAALALAACGSSSPEEPDPTPVRTAAPAATATKTPAAAAMSADEKAIRAALDGYVAAVRKGDTKQVCARYVARDLVKRIQALGSDCLGFMEDNVKQGGPEFRLDVSSVTVTGNRALVRARAYQSDGPRSGDTPMVRESGAWRLTVPSQP